MWGSKSFKIGRNEPCYCGSQLKFKKCCLNKTVVHTNDGDKWPKVSERVLELVSDYFDMSPGKTTHKSIISFACMAWNFAITNIHEVDDKIERDKIIEQCFPDEEARQIFGFIMQDLINLNSGLDY